MNDIEQTLSLQDVDLSTVETSFPLLATGVVTAQIQKCEEQRDTERKGDKAVPYLYVEYALTSPWKTVAFDGGESKPVLPGQRGSTIIERIYFGKYEDKKTREIKPYGIDRIARLREAVFGKAVSGTRFNPSELLGQTITLRLLFEPAPRNKDTGEVYGPRTSVAGYVKKGKN